MTNTESAARETIVALGGGGFSMSDGGAPRSTITSSISPRWSSATARSSMRWGERQARSAIRVRRAGQDVIEEALEVRRVA
ncbi:hypothetical protein AKH00_16290 [Microbacterium sp. GCS4]|nr:hypothetical protein AKH00_16290 [Microbacterium sp. GCS4]